MNDLSLLFFFLLFLRLFLFNFSSNSTCFHFPSLWRYRQHSLFWHIFLAFSFVFTFVVLSITCNVILVNASKLLVTLTLQTGIFKRKWGSLRLQYFELTPGSYFGRHRRFGGQCCLQLEYWEMYFITNIICWVWSRYLPRAATTNTRFFRGVRVFT